MSLSIPTDPTGCCFLISRQRNSKLALLLVEKVNNLTYSYTPPSRQATMSTTKLKQCRNMNMKNLKEGYTMQYLTTVRQTDRCTERLRSEWKQFVSFVDFDHLRKPTVHFYQVYQILQNE